jgi:thiol:disulfide interchange protein DsbC
MTRVLFTTMTAVMLCLAHVPASADEAAAVRAAVEKLDSKVKVEGPSSSAANGLYRVKLDGASGYVTADGRYFILGDMYDVKDRRNLTEDVRRQERLQALRSVDAGSAIVFAPAKPQHTITVFTDVDCGYCRKLHSEIAQYNERGIAVRYLAFPRSGPDTESWKTMEAVWCSKDRRDALTRAKRGEKIEAPASCETKAVARDYALGEQLGVEGTPMIVLEDGAVIGGYMPPAALAEQLNRLDQNKTAAAAGAGH